MMANWDKIKILQQQISTGQEEKAYSDLFSVCFPYLARFAFSFVHSREKSEEIASDVLIAVWHKRHQLNRIADLKLYLYKSTKNTSLNYLKKQQRTPEYAFREDRELWMKATDATPEQILISAELQQKIQNAIQQLPDKCRQIYKLIKEDGLKYKEVAVLLQLSVKTVEAQMAIAMKRLYEALRSVVQEPTSSINP